MAAQPQTRGRLVLLRHAKAEKDGPTDFERELSTAGRRDATDVGRRFGADRIVPDLALVSPSTRTRQTWHLVAAQLHGAATTVRFEPTIYDNDAEDLLELVRATPDDVRTLLLVGHNPSIEELARLLDDGGGDALTGRSMRAGFSTSAFAVLEHGSSWRLVAPHRLRVESFAPRPSRPAKGTA